MGWRTETFTSFWRAVRDDPLILCDKATRQTVCRVAGHRWSRKIHDDVCRRCNTSRPAKHTPQGERI